ncbi:nitroreductase family protein [Lachnospiraceae bacterium 54-53]
MKKFARILSVILSSALFLSILSGCQSRNSTQQSTEEALSVQAEADSTDGKSGAPLQNSSAEERNAVIQTILDSHSTKVFAEGAVSPEDLQLILESGAKAPSARNLQPWHFTVVTGSKVSGIIDQAAQGNVLIIISGADDAGEGMLVDYDCGLASAYLYLAAQSLGYGSHIYMGGVSDINQNKREELKIPDGYSAVTMMLIGNVTEDTDALSSATARNPLDDTVTYID